MEGAQPGKQPDTSNMTPEQIAQMQQENCIFCHIVSGKVQSKKVYEDPESIAILDINPANPGHVLILPKKHVAIMPQMNDFEIGHVFSVAKHMSGALLKALKAEGTNIFVANGAIAGQKAPHFMVHVIPRKEGDNLPLNIPENPIQPAELLKVKEMIMPKVKEHLGVGSEDTVKTEASARVPPTQESPPETAQIPPTLEPPQETAQIPPAQEQPQVTPEQPPGQESFQPVDLDKISSIINPASQPLDEVEKTEEEESEPKKGKIRLDDINELFKND